MGNGFWLWALMVLIAVVGPALVVLLVFVGA
jgi:hypothetical protein